MAITVSMIEEKEFKTKMRGYDPIEVDEFLDDICDEMVALQEEIATLNQRLAQAAQQQPSAYAPAAVPAPAPVAPVPAPVQVAKEQPTPQKEDSSEAAQKLLARAQKVYDETLADAKKEAQEILDSANEKAREQIGSLQDTKDALVKEVDELKAAAKDYRDRFLRLIEDQQHVLKAETALFDEE